VYDFESCGIGVYLLFDWLCDDFVGGVFDVMDLGEDVVWCAVE